MKRIAPIVLGCAVLALSALASCASMKPAKDSIGIFEEYVAKYAADNALSKTYEAKWNDADGLEWAGNLNSFEILGNAIRLDGKGNWASKSRGNEIALGTEVFMLFKVAPSSEFNTAITRGFWDNEKEGTSIQFGLANSSESDGIIGLNTIDSKDDSKTVHNSWSKSQFVSRPDTIYLAHFSILKDGSASVRLLNQNLKGAYFKWRTKLPDLLYNYEITCNRGSFVLYKYVEYQKK